MALRGKACLRRLEAGGAWGDGFAEDGWREIAAVRSWDDLVPDQYLRVFPRLLPSDGCVPAPIRAQLELRIEALREAAQAGDETQDATWSSLGQRVRRAARRWLAAAHPTTDARALARTEGPDRGRRPAADCAFLEAVLLRVSAGDTAAIDASDTARFAFLTGLHPAYLWSGALLTAERDGAAGWLGLLARGRAAFMPRDVADFFADRIVVRKGRPVALGDAELAGFLAGVASLEDVWRASQQASPHLVCPRRAGARVSRGSVAMLGQRSRVWLPGQASMVEPRA